MTNRQSTCEERIKDELAGRLVELRAIGDLAICQHCDGSISADRCARCGKFYSVGELDGDDPECPHCGASVESIHCRQCKGESSTDRDARREHWQERVLEVTQLYTRYRVGLSWGGPADGFYVDVDEDGEIVGGSYYFQDWFDGATRELSTADREELAGLVWLGKE